MARKSAVRTVINLSCETCKNRLYTSEKNRRNSPDRIELKKFCKFCRSHKMFKEVRS
jgi:large subunit ribosomal protein L33